jgi:uncharacterized membrane protein YphA (DoxX/SURF4 family)
MELLPWMLRLSLGIALIGSGTARAFISPILSDFPQFSFIQILLGFLLLIGFLLPLATLGTITLFIFALSHNIFLIGNADFLAAGIALLILANGKPGLDDLLGISFLSQFKKFRSYVPLVLRIGIGGAMIYLAVYEKFLQPHASALVVDYFNLKSVLPVSTALWVLGTGTIELIIGSALLLGFRTRIASAIAFIVLTLSFFYFGEDVYSHITLFGVLSLLFVTGGGKMSLDNGIY